MYSTTSAQSFSFVVTSDQRKYAGPGEYDTSSYYRGAIEAIGSVGAGAFMVVIGDMDPVQSTDWTIEQILGSDYIWYPVVGNHELPDAGTEDYSGANMDYLRAMNANGNTLPYIVNSGPAGAVETNYSFDYGNCHFIIINEYFDGTSDVGTVGDVVDALYNWLAADLAATTMQYTFILGHEPAFVQPDVETGRIRHKYDSLNEFTENRDRFWQLMVDAGVLAYICGHSHNYSLYNYNGVWQVNSGHAFGIADQGTPSTFIKFMINGDEVLYATYRVDSESGLYCLRYTGSLTSSEESTAIVPAGSPWSYLDDGSDQDTVWRDLNFDDSSWASGAAELGYGDGDENTVVSYGPDDNNKFTTTYFRHTFDLQTADIDRSLNLNLLRDDGAIGYLNGNEIYRTNMPDDSVNYQTFALNVVSGSEEEQFFTERISPSLFLPGSNVLAVEVHQVHLTSSDISFNLSLDAYIDHTPVTMIYGQLYLDINYNGFRDTDEKGLNGINVIVSDSQGSQTLITNPNGDWSAFVTPGIVTIDIDDSDPDFPVSATQIEGEDPSTITAIEGENLSAGFDGYYAGFIEVELVPAGSVWSYLDDGSDQDTVWRNLNFDDSSWASGAAELGYGDGDENTVVSYGPDDNNKFTTTYFRHTFDVQDADKYASLNLNLLRDDGAIVYLNGNEIYRTNMPDNSVHYQTFALNKVQNSEEERLFTQMISPSLLLPGSNVLAVEVHQCNLTSSDISFDLFLEGSIDDTPITLIYGQLYLDINYNGFRDTDDEGLSDVNVIVSDPRGSQIRTTNPNGDWSAFVLPGIVTIDIDESDPDFPATATQIEGEDPTLLLVAEEDSMYARADGYYKRIRSTVGDFVWNDVNRNGFQDEGEAGIKDVIVTLNSGISQIRSPLITDMTGRYEFTGLDSGAYSIQFHTLLANGVLTIQDANNNNSDLNDSDADGSGMTELFSLGTNETKTDIDAGIYILTPAQATGYIWRDFNINGIFDNEEVYFNSVTVNLLSADTLSVEGTATTDTSGIYTLTDIVPGNHILQVINPDPSIYAFSPKGAGTNDTNDCDVNAHGFTDVLTFGEGEIKYYINAGLMPKDSLTGIEDLSSFVNLPKAYALSHNFPNPFNPTTTIRYEISEPVHVQLSVYDILGQKVAGLVDEFKNPGFYSVQWNTANRGNRPVSAGIYFYSIQAGSFQKTRKMVLLK